MEIIHKWLSKRNPLVHEAKDWRCRTRTESVVTVNYA